MQHIPTAKCNVDTVRPIRDKGRSHARAARREEIRPLIEEAASAIGSPLADLDLVTAIHERDPDSVWAFERNGSVIGGVAFLFLNHEGVAALVDGRLDPSRPEPKWLVAADQKPVGIYVWALLGKGRAASPLSHGFVRLREPRYVEADLWALPFSDAGQRFTTAKGFEPVAERPGLHRFRRLALGPTAAPEI
jgi:hypothetical protein